MRRKDQMKFSEKMAAAGIVAVIFISIIYLTYKLFT